jgi:hypothetical protein
MRQFLAKAANLFRSPSAERELAREIDSYLAMLQEDFQARGSLQTKRNWLPAALMGA